MLQERNFDVTALDISAGCAGVMKARGIKTVAQENIYNYTGKFDTLLFLMNGIGLAGTLEGLKKLLIHLKELLQEGGQILFDSSDITYLYKADLPQEEYFGEIWYQYAYARNKTDWFKWLYIDEHALQKIADEAGYTMEVLLEDEYGQYLVRPMLNGN